MKKSDIKTLIAIFDWAVSKGGVAPEALIVAGLARQRALELSDKMGDDDTLKIWSDEKAKELENIKKQLNAIKGGNSSEVLEVAGEAKENNQ